MDLVLTIVLILILGCSASTGHIMAVVVFFVIILFKLHIDDAPL